MTDDEATLLQRKSVPGLVRMTPDGHHLILEAGYGADDGVVEYVRGVLNKSALIIRSRVASEFDSPSVAISRSYG